MKTAYKLRVTDKEIDKLCDAVIKVLGRGALDPDEIREATGNASHSLGEEGKKRGLTTMLPLALGKLQPMGEIRRVPVNGRLEPLAKDDLRLMLPGDRERLDAFQVPKQA